MEVKAVEPSTLLEKNETAKQSLWAARAVVMAAFLDLFLQFPIMALYATALGAPPALVGVVVGVYSATNLVGNVLGGVILDRWGRRIPLLIGLAVTTLALLLYVPAQGASQLLLARAVHGLAAAILTTGAFAMMGDVAPADRRARVMGRSGAIIAVAAIVGPPFAGLLRDRVGFGAVFLTSAAIMLLTLIFVWRWGHETRQPSPDRRRSFSASQFLARGGSRRLAAPCLAILAFTLALGAVVTHLPLLVKAGGASTASSGLTFAVYALVAMAAMLSPLTRLSDQRGRRGPLAGGLAFVALGLLILGLSSDIGGAALGMGIFGLGFGLLFPSSTALVVEATEEGERGIAFGVFYAVYSLGVIGGANLSGLVSQWQGQVTGLPFIIAAPAALLVLPAALSRTPRRWEVGQG